MVGLVALLGLILWGMGRYAVRNLESFTWPQEIAGLVTNVGLIILGTAVVFFFWDLMRDQPE